MHEDLPDLTYLLTYDRSHRSSRRRRRKAGDADPMANTLSLSGLLNALDGVAASEGRLLIA